jgi:hypothetical protein
VNEVNQYQGYQGSCNGSCPWLKSESDYLAYMALGTLSTGVFVVFRAPIKSRRGETVAKGVVFATIAFTLFVAWLPTEQPGRPLWPWTVSRRTCQPMHAPSLIDLRPTVTQG